MVMMVAACTSYQAQYRRELDDTSSQDKYESGAVGYGTPYPAPVPPPPEYSTTNVTNQSSQPPAEGTPEAERLRAKGIPAWQPPPPPSYSAPARGPCCAHCKGSQPCGSVCIPWSKTCHTPGGCAC